MNKSSKFFLFNTVATVLFSAIFDGICTIFLLNRGFSIISISFYFSISLICTSFFELPTGYIADRIGRKRSFAVGLFFRAIQAILITFTNNNLYLYMAGVFEAIYSSMTSGSLEAWLKGSEETELKSNNYSYIFGISKTLSSFVSIVVLLSVGLFVKTDLHIFYIVLAALYMGTAFSCLFYLKDNKNSGVQESFLIDAANIFNTYMKTKQLKLLTYILSCAYAFISIYMLYFQPKAIEMGLPQTMLLLMSAIRLSGGVLAGLLYTRFVSKIGRLRIIIISFFGILFSFISFLLAPDLIFLSITNLIYGLCIGVVMPVFFSWALEILSDKYTASLLSLMNAISSVVASITTVIAGYVIKNAGLEASMYIGVLLSITCIIILIYLYCNRKKIKNL